MNIIEYFSVKNDCYKNNINRADSRYTDFQRRGPQGLMLHSVGCSQSGAKVFADIWNQPDIEVAVHAALQADGTVYQCLPWNFRGWHAGGGANNTYVGVEMTEPDCIRYTAGDTFTCSDKVTAQAQVRGTYRTAVELFAALCRQYNLDPLADGVIISHREGYRRGVASDHGDPEHLWSQLGLGYTMDGFRRDVKAAMGGSGESAAPAESGTGGERFYRVRKSWTDAVSQIGAYKVLKNAKAACKPGYAVYDEKGRKVYANRENSLKGFIRAVQAAVGAAVDGIAGPETLGKTPTVSAVKNNRHGVVRAVQERLQELGYTQVGPADGIAGPKFTAAVKAYQKANGCVADGEITARNKTWRKLLGME